MQLLWGNLLDSESMQDTPDRVVHHWATFTSGLWEDPAAPLQKTFPSQHNEMVLIRDIPFCSLCEHHLLPFFGVAHVAYLPQQRVVGLSKIPRCLDILAARPQMQEQITQQLATTIQTTLAPLGTLVDAPVFFGFRYDPAPAGTDPTTLDGNGRVDINASSRLANGAISLPDLTTLQKTIVQLPNSVIDINSLIANSCIARSRHQGSFVTTGAGGLPTSPDDLANSPFPTYEIVSQPMSTDPLQPGNLSASSQMVEMNGIYPLPNGELLLGRSCL